MLKNRSIGTKVTICMVPLIALSYFSNMISMNLRLSFQFAQIMSGTLLALALAACMLFNYVLITKRLKKTVHMVQELSENHISVRLKVTSKDEVGRLSAAMNELADTLQYKLLGTLDKISKGDLNIETDTDDEADLVTPVIRSTVEAMENISRDTGHILESAKKGNLEERCETDSYSGIWAELADKINDLLKSISQPVSEVRNVMEKIAVNDYTEKVQGVYQGTFKNLADETNSVCDRLLHIQDAMIRISKGDTSTLDEAIQAGKRSENDNMVPTIIRMNQTIEDLISEIKRLTEEGVNGKILQSRGNSEKFEGGFREIIDGFNNTLDTISKPVVEILTVIEAMALNDYTSELSDNFKGDFKDIKDAVENVTSRLQSVQNVAVKISGGDISELDAFKKIGKRSENDRLVPAFIKMMESIQQLIDETGAIANAASEGNLDYKSDARKFSGEYRNIIVAFGNAFEEMARPLKEVSDVMRSMSDGILNVRVSGEYKGDFAMLADSVNLTVDRLNTTISEISETLASISKGNLNIKQLNQFYGDFAAISNALNAIVSSLNELIGSINSTAEEVAAGSAQVSQGSQSLSGGAAEQASAVEELTASISEIAQQTKYNAENSNHASKLVAQVTENASAGSDRMNEMLRSINEIGEASSNISKIIKVIDDIAFQTNILSLNAAVEAARAGQYGKGFAVVAEEVRNLASRSASAAKETTDLIESTVNKVNDGTQIAGKTAASFESIVDGVNKVSDIVSQINAFSNDQATGIIQIEQGLSQVSQVIQTTSATSEESAAASEELSGQAELLREQVSKFSLKR